MPPVWRVLPEQDTASSLPAHSSVCPPPCIFSLYEFFVHIFGRENSSTFDLDQQDLESTHIPIGITDLKPPTKEVIESPNLDKSSPNLPGSDRGVNISAPPSPVPQICLPVHLGELFNVFGFYLSTDSWSYSNSLDVFVSDHSRWSNGEWGLMAAFVALAVAFVTLLSLTFHLGREVSKKRELKRELPLSAHSQEMENKAD